jgi:transposase
VWHNKFHVRQRTPKSAGAHLKLSSVLSDIQGASGRAMLEAITAGERDPAVLAQLARKRARAKIPQLREALDCSFFTSDHAWLLKMMLARIDQYSAEVGQVTARIGELCQPWGRHLAQLATIPGVSERAAQDLIAEIGVDMGRFPTPAHLASWVRQAPGVSESAGHRKSKGADQGNPYSGGTLGEAAAAAARTQTFLGARYRRLVRHMPNSRHSAPSCAPSSSSPGTSYRTPTPSTTTSATTTTTAATTTTARPAPMPAPWSASATRSPSWLRS